MRLLFNESASKGPLSVKTIGYIGPPDAPPYAVLSHTWDQSHPTSEITHQQLPLFSRHAAHSRWSRKASFIAFFLLPLCGLCFWVSYLLYDLPLSFTLPISHALVLLFSAVSVNLYLKSIQEGGNADLLQLKQAGYSKIEKTLSLAHKHGLEHAWVDTCCIDKTSSAELTEAINSMYAWYAGAKVCFVYLSDLDPVSAKQNLEDALPKCRRHLFDKEWNERGTKATLSGLLSKITGIPEELLKGKRGLEQYSVARRMSWASRRETTREEDMTYCLLGIFSVNMTLRYGEGMDAFYRLQKAILEETADRSLFVWTDGNGDDSDNGDGNSCGDAGVDKVSPWSSILAKSPRSFACARHLEVTLADSIYRDVSIGPRGIQVVVSLIHLFSKVDEDDGNKCILDPFCTVNGGAIGVMIRKVSGGRYVRYKPWKLAHFGQDLSREPWRDINRTLVEQATLVTKLDTTFPFSEGFDPVLGNRHSALKLRLGSSISQFTVDQRRAMPRTHWDIHDNIFFCTNKTSRAWCGFFIHGQLAHSPTTCIPVNFFVGCIRWNIKRPLLILASLEDLEPGVRALLEYQLDKLEFESCRKAEAMIMSVFDGKLNGTTTVVETSVAEKTQMPTSNEGGTVFDERRIFQTNGPATSSPGWHYRVPSTGEKVRVEISGELVEEEDQSLCVNPVIMLDLRLRLLE